METRTKVGTDPVFVMGYKRSGTTMFRLILNSHPGLAIPPESEYFQIIPVKLGNRFHLTSELDQIVDIISQMDRCDFQLGLTANDIRKIIEPALPATTPELIAALYRYWGEVQGKKGSRWGDKKPQHWQFVYRLKEWYPESKFIHIVRDPRDVFASVEEHFPEQVIGRGIIPAHIITAWQWRMANEELIKQGKELGPKRYCSFKYEALVQDPEEYCRKCCKFLEIEYSPQMLEFQKSAKDPSVQGAKTDGGAHQQTTRKVHSGRIGRFKASLLPEEIISDIEYICMDLFDIYDWSRSGFKVKPVRALFLKAMCNMLDMTWNGRRFIKKSKGSL